VRAVILPPEKPRQAAINPDGTLAYTSVSAIKKFMACPASWFFRYKLRRPDPQGVGAALGEKCHGESEHYFKTTENLLGDIPRAALLAGIFPEPGKPGPYANRLKDGTVRMLDIMVEQNFGADGFGLEAEGVPFKGFIDLVNPRGLEGGAVLRTHMVNPKLWTASYAAPKLKGLVQVLDWKFKKDIVKYGTSPEALLDPTDEDGLQMVGYAMAVHNAVKAGHLKGATYVQVGHGHVQTVKNRAGIYPTNPILAKPIPIESAPDLWLTVSPVVKAMKQVAKADSVEQVEGKKSACYKYGGCAYRSECPHFKKPANQGFRLTELFKTKGKETNDMGILNKMKSTPAAAPVASPTEDKSPVSPARDTTPKPTLIVEADDAVLPPDAPASGENGPKSIAPAPAVEAAPAPTSTDPISNPEPVAEKPKRTRRTKAEMQAESIPAAGNEPVSAPAALPVPESTRAAGFTLCVGRGPTKGKASSLIPYVDALEQTALAGFKEQLKVDVDDIRLATGSDVGFGKWKAVLGALAKQTPPAPGTYTIPALNMDERVDAVFVALESLATEVYR
jgi:hypothetical protein